MLASQTLGIKAEETDLETAGVVGTVHPGKPGDSRYWSQLCLWFSVTWGEPPHQPLCPTVPSMGKQREGLKVPSKLQQSANVCEPLCIKALWL